MCAHMHTHLIKQQERKINPETMSSGYDSAKWRGPSGGATSHVNLGHEVLIYVWYCGGFTFLGYTA